MFKFRINYFILSLLLFTIEILIAVYLRHGFIRLYAGDFLVVILIYCFLRSFWKKSITTTAVCVLIFAYAVEILQYFKFVQRLGLQKSAIAKVVLGSSFSWLDMLAYTFGILLVLLIEKRKRKTPATILF